MICLLRVSESFRLLCPKCGHKMSPRTQREAKEIEKRGLMRRYYVCQPRRQGAIAIKGLDGVERAIGCGHAFWSLEMAEKAFDQIAAAAMKYDEIARMTGGESITGLPTLREINKERTAKEMERAAKRKQRREAKKTATQQYADATGRSTNDEKAEAEHVRNTTPSRLRREKQSVVAVNRPRRRRPQTYADTKGRG